MSNILDVLGLLVEVAESQDGEVDSADAVYSNCSVFFEKEFVQLMDLDNVISALLDAFTGEEILKELVSQGLTLHEVEDVFTYKEMENYVNG